MRLTHRLGRRARWGSAGVFVPPSGLWTPSLLSRWETLGNSATAIGDSGKWGTFSADYDVNGAVVAAPGGEGFVTPNVLKCECPDGTRAGWLDVRATVGEIAIDEVRNFRVKFSNHHPTAAEGATDNSHHGFQDGGAGSVQNFNLTDGTNFAGEWEPNILVANGGGGRYYLGSSVTPLRLAKAVGWTFDFQMMRTATTTFRLMAWVYNAAGTLVYSPADWKSGNYSGETMATERQHTINHLPGTATIGVGLNGTGFSGWPGTPLRFGYWGEFAYVSSLLNPTLALGTSIGVYGTCTGET